MSSFRVRTCIPASEPFCFTTSLRGLKWAVTQNQAGAADGDRVGAEEGREHASMNAEIHVLACFRVDAWRGEQQLAGVDISGFASGSYYCRLKAPHNLIVRPFVIQK